MAAAKPTGMTLNLAVRSKILAAFFVTAPVERCRSKPLEHVRGTAGAEDLAMYDIDDNVFHHLGPSRNVDGETSETFGELQHVGVTRLADARTAVLTLPLSGRAAPMPSQTVNQSASRTS
jgi:hypothetical protein